MSDSIKRIFLFLLMFIVVISLTTLASSLQIKEVEIIFSDGTKTHLTVSANKTAEEILKENNIVLLENEKIRDTKDSKKIYIDKIDSNTKIVKTEVFSNLSKEDIEKNYSSIEEKIEIEKVEIPFQTVTKTAKDTEENNSNSMVVQIGENGIKEIKYKALYKNNELIERKQIEENIIKQPKDKIVQLVPKVTSRALSSAQASVRYSGGKWNYSDSELDLLCAITAQESGSSYEGALAVITTACNRTASSKWRANGSDPLSQYKAKGQFTYSIDNHWRKRLNGNYPGFVKQAVIDALNGKRNHDYTSFKSSSHASRVGISGLTIGGNTYHR